MALSMASGAAGATILHAAAAPTRVTLAYPSPSPRVAPLWVAQDLDFFGKYGVRAQVVLVRNNQMLTAGLISGDLEVGYTGGTTVLGAAAAGAELKMIADFVSRGKGHLLVRLGYQETGGLSRQTHRRPKHRRDDLDVRHARHSNNSVSIWRATRFACSSSAIKP